MESKKHKKYRLSHPDRVKASKRKQYVKNLEKHRKQKMESYYRHHDKRKEDMKKYNKTHRSLINALHSKRRALLRAVQTYNNADMQLLKLIYINCPKGYHVDHIFPVSKGGLHHPENLQYLPAVINVRKNAKIDYECSQYIIRWQDIIK